MQQCPHGSTINDIEGPYCPRCGAKMRLRNEQSDSKEDRRYFDCLYCGHTHSEVVKYSGGSSRSDLAP
jgi:transposase-like protein